MSVRANLTGIVDGLYLVKHDGSGHVSGEKGS